MTFISKAKIPPWSEVFPQIEEIVADQKDTPFCVSIPYGLQLQNNIWNSERLRIVAHVDSASGHSFISHHGVGKKNEINIWNFSMEIQPGNTSNGSFKTISTELKFLHILFVQRRWVYVTYCTDLSIKVFSAKFHILSTTSANKTVLSLAYNEIRDEIITGIAGGIMTWKFPIGQTDSLIPGQLIRCSFTPFDWVMSLALDDTSKQILAISDVTISMIDLQTHIERCFFQKKCDVSFTTCVIYNPASYFITGDKNGSIRAWSTSLNSFPMVTQFLGHTAEITKLLIHPQEPLLVSSSMDKTIRIWNMDTSTQTFKLETGEEIIEMDLLSADLLYFHSYHHVKIWSLNLFHSLFTALSSRILRWTRVKSPGCPARVLVHGEDGGVRLVSPVHGNELTTVLPITTMTADIVDVAHDPRQEKIYLVLGTGEVLVFESDTNPCCAYQLWVPGSPDEGVCSLAMINAEFAVHENEINLKSGLLFAGQYNGQISLVSGKDIYMKENLQAHQGQVTFLRVSNSFTESPDTLASRDHLISYGTDCTVRIWQLIHPEITRVSIQQVVLVKLLQSPKDLAMAGNTLCMAMADNSVIMCRLRDERKDKNSILNTHEFLTHSKDELHTAPINGLSCCSALGLFATSSEDQSVKIWNTDNHLVRELCFDKSLRGVCFANSRGDLLVGFQSHISVVTILNYLPPSYLEILSKMHFNNDPFEEHVQFDDMLKFWYDPERVPRMPLAANKRRSLERPEIKITRKRKKKEIPIEKPEMEEEMDVFEKRRQSRRRSTQVHVLALRRLSTKSSSMTMISQTTKSVEENVSEKPVPTTDFQLGQVPASLENEKADTEVYWPCAPDGYIPNSVVRSLIKPRRPFAVLIPWKKRRKVKSKKEKTMEERDDDIQDEGKISDFWTLYTRLQKELVKTNISEASAKVKEQGSSKSRRPRVPERISSKLGRGLRPRRKAGGQFSEPPLMELEEIEGEKEMKEHEDKGPEEIDEFLQEEKEEEVEEEKEGEMDEEVEEKEGEMDEEETSEESPASSPESSVPEEQESPDTMVEISDEEEDEDEDEEFQSSSEGESTTSVMKLEIPPTEVTLLTQIQRKKWYPTLERQSSHAEVEEVVDNMLKTLARMNSLETIKDICEQFMSVKREFGIPDDKMIEIEERFIELSYNLEPSARQAAVWALGELDTHRKDAYLSIVRRLIDEDEDTREEAKRVLKNLTGVDTMEGLSRLIMTSGVVSLYLPCNDNAVLLELADRVRQDKWKKKANKTVLVEDDVTVDHLRTTLRRKPFKTKFRNPKVMARTRPPRTRIESILEEPASLSNTEKLQSKMRESTLGCKLLQKMEPFKNVMISIREKGGESLPEIEAEVKDDCCTEDVKMRQNRELTQLRLAISPEENTLQTSPTKDEDSAKLRLAISPEEKTLQTSTKGEDSEKSYTQECSERSTPNSNVSSLQQAPSPTRKLSNRCFDDKSGTGVSPTHHPELLSMKQIFKVVDCVKPLPQPSDMLLLLKMKRTKGIQIAQEDGSIQKFYTMGDLLEILCHMSPLAEDLASLTHKVSKSKEEILMNMRILFRKEALDTLQRDNRVVINGLGRLPLSYLQNLLDLRLHVFDSIKRYLEHADSLSSSSNDLSKSLVSLLKGGLWLCAILEPDNEEDDHFIRSNLTSQRKGEYTTIPEIYQETDVTRKKLEEQPRPIFEQPSHQYCLGPGTHGQRLLNSTLIRRRALSDFRSQSSRETRNLVVASIPHRLSVHTGKTIEGESHFGIMELKWRAGTPLPKTNDETPNNAETNNFPLLSGKPVELKEQYIIGKRKQNSRTKIPKSQGVPPLCYRKVKPFAEKRLDMLRAANSLQNNVDSLTLLSEFKSIIKKKYLDKSGNLLARSFTDFPRPSNTDTPIPLQESPSALHSSHNESMTSVKSTDSSERCSRFYDLPRDMTRDMLLNELNKFHLPPIWK